MNIGQSASIQESRLTDSPALPEPPTSDVKIPLDAIYWWQ